MNDKRRERINEWLSAVEKKVIKLYGETYAKALNLPEIKAAVNAGDDEFDWSKYPGAEAKIEKMLSTLTKQLDMLISDGVKDSFDGGMDGATSEVRSLLGASKHNASEVAMICRQATNQRREEGLTGWNYIQEKRGGFTLSERVWQSTRMCKQELAIMVQNGVIEGKTAQQIAGDVKGCLREPNRLFRRVRDKETGLLRLSEAAKAYHPGQGVYRSSYKNALRVARTEVNQAYRVGECVAYEGNPLVKGYKIALSNNHTTKKPNGTVEPLKDICDKLAGEYPKWFKFSGWHPQCRCHMVPIPLSPKEVSEYLKHKKAGTLDKWKDPAIKEMPKNFRNWVAANKNNIEMAVNRGKLPYFLQDNPYSWQERPRLTPKEIAKIRHQNRTEEQEQAILNKWEEHKRIDAEVRKLMKEQQVPSWRNSHYDEIEACKNTASVENLLLSLGVASEANLSSMSTDGAKKLAHAVADMSARFGLYPIKVGTARMGRGVMAHAHGKMLEVSPSYWNKKNITEKSVEVFFNCASNFVERNKSLLENYKKYYEDAAKKAKELFDKGDPLWRDYERQANRYKKSVEGYEEKLEKYTRHNVILSAETALRDVVVHEAGHVVHGQILHMTGGWARHKRINVQESIALDNELQGLYDSYKASGGTKWLSQYGMTNYKEFFAESMALYMNQPEAMPTDVRNFFNKVEAFASGGNISASSGGTMTYQEAYKLYMEKEGARERIRMAAEKRHANKEHRELVRTMAASRQRMKKLLLQFDGSGKHVGEIMSLYKASDISDAGIKRLDDGLKKYQLIIDHKRDQLMDLVTKLDGIADIDTSSAKACMGGGRYVNMAEQEKVLDEYKTKLENAKHIADPIGNARKFGFAGLMAAEAAVERTFKRWTWDFDTEDSLNFLKGRLEREINVVEGAKGKYATWEIVRDAYKDRLKLVEQKIVELKFNKKIDDIEARAGGSKKVKGLVEKAREVIANGVSNADIQDLIDKAEDIIKKNEQSRLQKKAKRGGAGAVATPIGKSMTQAEAVDAMKDLFAKNGIYLSDGDVAFENGHVMVSSRQHEALHDIFKPTEKDEDKIWSRGWSHGYIRTGHSFTINGCLRDVYNKGANRVGAGPVQMKDVKDNQDKYGERLDDDDVQTISTLDKIIAKTLSPVPMVLVRNVNYDAFEAMTGGRIRTSMPPDAIVKEVNNQYSGGGVFVPDPGFMSTSTNAKANVFQGRDVQLRIYAPAGTPMHITKNYPESEVILGRLTKFRFKSVRKTTYQIVVEVEIVN